MERLHQIVVGSNDNKWAIGFSNHNHNLHQLGSVF